MKRKQRNLVFYKIVQIVIIAITIMTSQVSTYASTVDVPDITINLGGENTPEESASSTLQMIFIITIIALAPSILIMMTSFLRVIISLHFVRSAMGTQTMPPNQILVGLALFLTFFIMSPVFMEIKTNAIDPLERGQITQEQAIDRGVEPLKKFMLRQTRDEDISLFMDIADVSEFNNDESIVNEIPLYVIVPAFIINELRAGFIIGFLIYIPFIIIDMVVAATLMSMGMMMLPPAMISLPFKLLLFIMVDGWNLFIGEVISTFN